MPSYLIQHPAEQRREDMLIEDDELTLAFVGGWAVFTDGQGVCLAVPAGQGAHIQRVDSSAAEQLQTQGEQAVDLESTAGATGQQEAGPWAT
ncbi:MULTISPECIES: hypothetical protein [Streptomyces]|uniref:Uncharacterized protein n=2 Tax=Streptomyces venezuelae TaxID=54571 RepID=F2RL35_STRVP|nr:hypothetical protein [Streptomyces venezuelae]APE21402.1 hypothetical protein vnz_10450 [Streptomyces venezuelae]QER98791.1 hypothetical protein DEJ43_10590 [Streptomyces venezuelae ATCC 10712]CCA55424.1 hypothetical protein SVEN_2138 [Streptomyces venezuelae ATCC 10712]